MKGRAMQPEILETKRLTLRPLSLIDAQSLHFAFRDADTMRYWDSEVHASIDVTLATINKLLAVDKRWFSSWVITFKEEHSNAIGMICYHHREQWNDRLEIGYLLQKEYWKRGYMREALLTFLDYCFIDLRVHRVEAFIEPRNTRSIRLIEDIGFKAESGILHDRIKVGGKYRDALMYAKVASPRHEMT